MTPLIVIAVLVALVILVSGSVMRRSRRDYQATRKYHRALDTLGALNEAGPVVDRSVTAPGRSGAGVAIPSNLRRAQALREKRAERADPSAAAAPDGVERDDGGSRAGAGEESGTTAVEGVRILGPVSGRPSGEVPVVRARLGGSTARLLGAPRQPPAARASDSGAGDHLPALPPADPAPPLSGANGAAADGPPSPDDSVPDSVEDRHDAEAAEPGTSRRPMLVFGAEEEPPGRSPAFAGPDAGMVTRPAHLRRRRGGRRALVAAATTVIVAGAAVGAYEAAGGSGLPTSPAAAKRPVVSHKSTASSTTVPATTPPAPTTSVPPFTLVSNTNGTASYQVAGSPTVVVSAQGSCWVQANQANAQGSSIFAALMSPGQSETFHAPVFLRLGAPWAVTVTVNGQSLPALVTGGAAWNVELQ